MSEIADVVVLPSGSGERDGEAGFEGMATVEVVRVLGGGEVSAGEVPVEVRRRCVGELGLEGFSESEIAGLLGVSERTVRRDRRVLREEGAVKPSEGLGDEMLGEMERVAAASNRRLARLANEPGALAYARLWAEEAMVRNYERVMGMAKKMGYFDDGGRRIRAERGRRGLVRLGAGRLNDNRKYSV